MMLGSESPVRFAGHSHHPNEAIWEGSVCWADGDKSEREQLFSSRLVGFQ